jgi:hypothetical protein
MIKSSVASRTGNKDGDTMELGALEEIIGAGINEIPRVERR